MKFLTARSRITFGLACILVSVVCTAMMLGLVPERESAVLAGRAKLCETIAMCGSDYIARGEQRRLEHLLRSVVERNDDLLSAGVRRANGKLVAEVGNHSVHWTQAPGDRSTDTNVHVPIRSGKEKWGSIELQFRRIESSAMAGFLSTWVRLTIFVTAACYLFYFFYLGKMLQHLDPSKAVPKRVRTALDSLAEGLLVVDREQRIVLANQAIAAWVGCAPEKLIGFHASKLSWVSDEQNEPLTTYPWVTAIEQEMPQAGVTLGLAHKNKPTQILIANASPVLGHDGNYRGVLVSFADVSQLEETKRDLRVAKKAAEDASQAKSSFLACMSHEIRTPMNAILGFTDVLCRGFDESTKDRQEYLDTIHASGEHLLALINDILDLSKIESGRMELELQRCSPHQLLMQVVSLLRSKSDEKGITLAFECDGPLPETILTDAVRLRQAIVNLAGNAIKFTEQGGVRIVARLVEGGTADNDQLLLIDVIDTGIGISRENQQTIFHPFSQADNSIARRFGGTGLGLSISRQLAEAMGGSVSVTSEPGHGSTFTVTIDPGSLEGIPLIDSKTALAQVAERVVQKKATIQLPSARVLVADDGQSNRKLIQLVLRRAGAEVVLVENGQLAVESAKCGNFDVILMDMQMPVVDGYTATTMLRDAGYDKPIIALTAHAMQGNEEKCRAAGCSDYLTKPINIDTLLTKLAEVLEVSGRHLPVGGQPEPARASATTTQDVYEADCGTTFLNAPEAIECSYPLDDPEFQEIAEEFEMRLKEKLAAMREASSRTDSKELSLLAHWLKGSGGTAGFDVFNEPAHELELAATSLTSESWDELISRLENMAARIRIPRPHHEPDHHAIESECRLAAAPV